MVYDSKIIKILYNQLKKLKIPIVVDPVIQSTTGGALIKKSAIKDFQKYLIPLATVITPNKFEAEILSKTKGRSDARSFVFIFMNEKLKGYEATFDSMFAPCGHGDSSGARPIHLFGQRRSRLRNHHPRC